MTNVPPEQRGQSQRFIARLQAMQGMWTLAGQSEGIEQLVVDALTDISLPSLPDAAAPPDAERMYFEYERSSQSDASAGNGLIYWGSPTIDEANGKIYFATGNAAHCPTGGGVGESIVELNAADLSSAGSWQAPAAHAPGDSDFGITPTLFQATINGVLRFWVGVANKNGIYYALDPATGAFHWESCLAKPILAPVPAVPGLLVVGSGPNIAVLDAATGKQVYTYLDTSHGSLFWGAASISNGVIYQGNLDGTLYALGLSSTPINPPTPTATSAPLPPLSLTLF